MVCCLKVALATPKGPKSSNNKPTAQPTVKEVEVKAKLHVTLKSGVLDPQGKAIQHTLSSLGFGGVNDVRQGKFIELDLEETNEDAARAALTDMCEKLLANTVIENYDIELIA